MKPTSLEIFRLFQNEKVCLIYENSDGQGLIFREIERNLTFSEILELESLILLNFSRIEDFSIKYQHFPNTQLFISNFQSKIEDLVRDYQNVGESRYILKLINENKKRIRTKYPAKDKNESYSIFLTNYQSYYTGLGNKTYEESKGFFNDPIDFF